MERKAPGNETRAGWPQGDVAASVWPSRIQLVGQQEGVLRVGRTRVRFVFLAFATCFAVLAMRLVDLTLLSGNGEAAAQRAAVGTDNVARADIVDRNGVLLATNLTTASLYADPRLIHDAGAVADALVRVLPDQSYADLVAKLTSDRAFVWLRRNLTPTQQFQINTLGIPGLAFQEEQRRVYPQGSLAAHVLGFTDIDNKGIAGVEQFFDESLRGQARRGEAVALSLDIRVQHAVRDELRQARAKFGAQGVGGVVVDVDSGEVLSLVSLPDFDPNHANAASDQMRFNRMTLGVYELGSVFKIFTVAMGLDSGVAKLKDGYDASEPIRVSRFTIRDDHARNRWLSVPEILIYSSNIGAAKMALDMGRSRQRQYMANMGLLRRPALELPEIGAPLQPDPWREINTMTAAYGHGIAVSPLQVAVAAAAVTNGGVMRPPTLVRRDAADDVAKRVLSRRTSDVMRRLLRRVVVTGTGKKANAEGYLVGGKTGTAEKANGRGYNRRALLTSFVAAFPMTRPRYVVYVLLDEPQGIAETHGYAGAGWNAAPTVGRIIARIAPILGVRPIDETQPRVQDAMAIPLYSRRPKLASF